MERAAADPVPSTAARRRLYHPAATRLARHTIPQIHRHILVPSHENELCEHGDRFLGMVVARRLLPLAIAVEDGRAVLQAPARNLRPRSVQQVRRRFCEFGAHAGRIGDVGWLGPLLHCPALTMRGLPAQLF